MHCNVFTPYRKSVLSTGKAKARASIPKYNFVSEYDYDGEYTLPSNGPPPIREPPGAFSTGSRLEKFNSVFFAVIVWLFRTCLR